jgi:hypothetical protein
MGFTPWSYDAIQSAVDDVNQRIQDNGDIVDHHVMVGVPSPMVLPSDYAR